MVRWSSKRRGKTEEKKAEKKVEKKEKKRGYASGKRKTKIEVIGRMLNENFDKDTIKKIAKATDEEIEEARATK